MKFHDVDRYTDHSYASNGESLKMVKVMHHSWSSWCMPYYKIWPSVLDQLLKIQLDVELSAMKIRNRTLALRFPVGSELGISGLKCYSILSMMSTWLDCDSLSIEYTGGCQIPEVVPEIEMAGIQGAFWFKTDDGGTIENELARHMKSEIPESDKLVEMITRVTLAVHLLAEDPTIIEPDVLSKDELKYERTKDQKYVDKARRRGKVGWHIGKTFETIPHYRRPHPALYHVGKGRKEQRIVFRAGSVVHREKMTKVPTGYITPEGVEVES